MQGPNFSSTVDWSVYRYQEVYSSVMIATFIDFRKAYDQVERIKS